MWIHIQNNKPYKETQHYKQYAINFCVETFYFHTKIEYVNANTYIDVSL